MKSWAEATYSAVLDELKSRLAEPAPGRVQILSGPRQVGKTTLLLEVARQWGSQALYAAADSPEASLPGWWESQWAEAGRLAARGQAVLLVDEIQYLSDWTRLLKAKVDVAHRHGIRLHVVVTGSSALHLGAGARETMAGRFERLRLLHWPPKELARCFGLTREEAVRQYVRYGSFPGALPLLEDPTRWKDYIRTSIAEPALGRDILALHQVRKPAMLRQVFAVAAGHPGEIVSLQKLCGQLSEKGAQQTVAHYLSLLEEACLVAGVQKFSGSVLRQRSAPPKLVVLSQAFLTAMSNRPIADAETDTDRWGRWVENACLARAWNAGQQVEYWRREPLEVDMVLSGSWGQWAVEVKTGSWTTRQLAGLFEFCRMHPKYRPLVLCDEIRAARPSDAAPPHMAWQDFLWQGLGGEGRAG